MELKQEKVNIKKAQADLKEDKKQLYPPRPVTEILFSQLLSSEIVAVCNCLENSEEKSGSDDQKN